MAKKADNSLLGTPDHKPAISSLTFKASGKNTIFTAKWSYPSDAFSSKNRFRAEGVGIKWDANHTSTSGNNTIIKFFKGSSKRSSTYSLNRSLYYPFKDTKRVVKYVYVYRPKKITVKKYKKGKRKGQKYVTVKWSRIKRSVKVSEYKALIAQNMLCRSKAQAMKNMVLWAYYDQKQLVKKNYWWFDSLRSTKISAGDTYNVTQYQPKITNVTFSTMLWNQKSSRLDGSSTVTPETAHWTDSAFINYKTHYFKEPLKPAVTKSYFTGKADDNSQRVKFDVDARCDRNTIHERYDTSVKITVAGSFYNYKSGKYELLNEKNITGDVYKNGTNYKTAKKFTVSVNPNGYITTKQNGYKRTINGLIEGEYLLFSCRCTNRGFCGTASIDSPATYLVAYPHRSSIKSIVQKGQHYHIVFQVFGEQTSKVDGKDVKLRRRKTKNFVLERVRNYMPDSDVVEDWNDAQWLNYIKADPDARWETVDTLTHDARSFSDSIYQARPAGFTRTFYRIKATSEINGIPDVYSDPFQLPYFNRIPSAKNEMVNILAINSMDDGEGLQVLVNFSKTKSNGAWSSNGTELTWDTASYAWKSNQKPSSYDYLDSEIGHPQVTQALKVKNTAIGSTTYKKLLKDAKIGTFLETLFISGLSPMTPYYVKARRFLKESGYRSTESYSKNYAEYKVDGKLTTVMPTKRPEDVKLYAPEQAIWGRDFSVTWSFNSEAEQEEYSVMWMCGDSDAAKEDSKVLVNKVDKAPYAVIPWSEVQDKFFEGTLYLGIKMKTKDFWSDVSEISKVSLIVPPTAALGNVDIIDGMPFNVTLYTNDPNAAAIVRITSHGVDRWGPDGFDRQPEGFVVYSDKIYPKWIAVDAGVLDSSINVSRGENNSVYSYNLELADVPLRNNGSYLLEYSTVNDEYGLTSIEIDSSGDEIRETAELTVEYTQVPVAPSCYAVVPYQSVEHMGHDPKAYVCMFLDSSYTGNQREYLLNECVADVYRITPDGVYIIAEGISPWHGRTVVDSYPAYSKETSGLYRVALRSPDGDVEWSDAEYRYPGYSVRFDWGDPANEERGEYTHLTLPYNLSWSDNWSKNARVELHLDGNYIGQWRRGADRKNSLSTQLARIEGTEQCDRVRALAKYSGPVLVRLPDGCCFAANVTVSGLQNSYDSLTMSVSFEAQEIRMVDDFRTTEIEDGLMAPVEYKYKSSSWYKSIVNGS